jgi:hypothetical protein
VLQLFAPASSASKGCCFGGLGRCGSSKADATTEHTRSHAGVLRLVSSTGTAL